MSLHFLFLLQVFVLNIYIYMYTQAKLVSLAPNSVPLCPLANPDLQMSDSVQTDQPLSLVSRSLIKPDLRLTRTTAKPIVNG